MKDYLTTVQFRFALILITLLSLSQIGCNRADTNETKVSSPLHNQKFHQPKNFDEAIKRLGEMYQSIVSDGPLPGPRKLKVVEIIHGEGVSAHSHFHVASEHHEDGDHDHEGGDHDHEGGDHDHEGGDHDHEGGDHDHDHEGGDHDHEGGDHDHDHEGMPSREKFHDIEIDIFTEFVDIVGWLPRIAADSQMPEKSWSEVKAVSEQFEGCLNTTLKGDLTEAEKRDEIINKRQEIEGYLKQLESHATTHSNDEAGGR